MPFFLNSQVSPDSVGVKLYIQVIMDRRCAEGAAEYSGISSVDPSGDALGQLSTILSDMKSFFQSFIPNCQPRNINKKNEKLDRWEVALTEKFNTIN